jgi:hypothetical protein
VSCGGGLGRAEGDAIGVVRDVAILVRPFSSFVTSVLPTRVIFWHHSRRRTVPSLFFPKVLHWVFVRALTAHLH